MTTGKAPFEARRNLDAAGFTQVHVICGDGTLGWPEHAPYDAVMVTGLNLPMLMSVWNYRGQPLGSLARKAVDSGRRGVKIFQQ